MEKYFLLEQSARKDSLSVIKNNSLLRSSLLFLWAIFIFPVLFIHFLIHFSPFHSSLNFFISFFYHIVEIVA